MNGAAAYVAILVVNYTDAPNLTAKVVPGCELEATAFMMTCWSSVVVVLIDLLFLVSGLFLLAIGAVEPLESIRWQPRKIATPNESLS